MKRVIALGATLALLLALVLVRLLKAQSPSAPSPPLSTYTLTDLGPMQLTAATERIQNLRLTDAYGRLPLSFESNEGQTDPGVKFLSRGAGRTLFFTATEAVLTSGKGNAVHMELLGANRNAQVVGVDRLPGNSNYFLGANPAKWRANVRTYTKVRYSQIYPGVDLIYYGNQRELEYDFLVAPEADPAQIRLGIQAATRLWIDADGSAVLRCNAGDIRLLRPHLYQQIRGRKIKVNGSYVLKGHELRFAVGQYDHHEPLVIDPVLVYSTYLGGSGGDSPTGIAVDSSGNAYITGQTNSLNFPGAPGNGKFQNFVVKLNTAGNAVLYSTYISGSGTELAKAISVDGTGNAYIAGYTNSIDFPVRNALQATNHGGYDAFLAKLDASGNLVYSTYLGGSKDDEANAIALDSAGNAYLTGQTGSSDFPGVTSNSAQHSLVSNFFNAFVAKVSTNGSALGYATYLGGSGQDAGEGIAVDSSGNAYVAGNTSSFNFPVAPSAFQHTFGGGSQDGFVTQVNASGTAFNYSTYLGGSDNDFLNAIALDATGNAYLTGRTASVDFPGVTAASLQPTNVGTYNAVVAKLSPTGTALLYSTYLGGFAVDTGNGIAVDTSGNVYITGTTRSTNFPVMSAIQSALGGGSDAFLSQLNSTGTALLFSTYLGGSGNDGGNGIALDSSGNVYVTGDTASSNFPATANVLQAAYGGNNDAFVAKLSAASAAASTNTTLSASANPSVFGQQVSFSVAVTPIQSSSLTPTGNVTFSDGSTVLGTVPLSSGSATFNAGTLGVGSHTITASYAGDNNFGSSTSAAVTQIVNQAGTTTSLAASPNPSNFGQTITFTATVTVVAPGSSTPTAPTGTVTFSGGTSTLGTALLNGAATATFSTSSLASGSHSVTATYGGDTNFGGSSSSSVNQVISQSATSTALAASPNPANLGQTVTFTATVTVIAPGVGTPTGTVTFLDGPTTLGIGVLSPASTATLSTSSLAVGSHTVTASYGGDTTFAGSTSAGVIVTVQAPPPVQVMVSETVHMTDTPSFPDVFDAEQVSVTDQVMIQVLNTTTTSISAGAVVYGTPASVTVSVGSSTAAITGNVALSVDGGAATTLLLASGSATFDLGVLPAGGAFALGKFCSPRQLPRLLSADHSCA